MDVHFGHIEMVPDTSGPLQENTTAILGKEACKETIQDIKTEPADALEPSNSDQAQLELRDVTNAATQNVELPDTTIFDVILKKRMLRIPNSTHQ